MPETSKPLSIVGSFVAPHRPGPHLPPADGLLSVVVDPRDARIVEESGVTLPVFPHPKGRQDRFQFAITQTELPADHRQLLHPLALLRMADPFRIMQEGASACCAFVSAYLYAAH